MSIRAQNTAQVRVPAGPAVTVPAQVPAQAPATPVQKANTPTVQGPVLTPMGARLMDETRQASATLGGKSLQQSPQMARFQGTRAAEGTAPAGNTELAKLAERLKPAPAGSTAEADKPMGAFQRFWRDFGINPVAMVKRAVTGKADEGARLEGGLKAQGGLLNSLNAELSPVLAGLDLDGDKGLSKEELAAFKTKLGGIAAKYGVNVEFKQGAPTVAWKDVPTLEVMDGGGMPAAHEMVHAVQCVVGGVAALSTAAAARIQRETGRAPRDENEVRAMIPKLTPAERKTAFDAIVVPMETQAYARFEEGAFQATGMMGKKAKDVERYSAGLKDNLDAFTKAYLAAEVPDLTSNADARTYGSIGHLARTHGETALLLGAGGAAYATAAKIALAINPVVGAVALLPLAYLSFRTMMG